MSHFVVYVIGAKNEAEVSEKLDPFWELDLGPEEIKVHPYARFSVEFTIAQLENDFLNWKEENPEWAEKYVYDDAIAWVTGWHEYDLNEEEGGYGYWCNPDAKWDWFLIGGRWCGMFPLKDGVEGEKGRLPMIMRGEEVPDDRFDISMKKDIDWDAMVDEDGNPNFAPFALVTEDGEWIERGAMGWWCMVGNEKDQDDWDKIVKNILDKVPDDTYIAAVDCHI
jgi:hypothetical protein